MEKISTRAKAGEPPKPELEGIESSTYQAYSYYRAVSDIAFGWFRKREPGSTRWA